MPKQPEEIPETIRCKGKECECDIPIIDCYFINKPDVPQIGIKCPECSKVTILSKAKSIEYCKEYPQIQQDIDNAAGFKIAEPEFDEDFGDRLMRVLDAFGYGGTKNTQKKKIIRSMIDIVPAYQNEQALHNLLLSRGIKPMDAQQISQLVCMDDQPQFPQPGALPQQPMSQQMPYQQPIGQPQMPYQQPMQQPAYPYQQPMPQQMPYQQPAPPAATNDDNITIIEKLGDDGQVIERVIKQPKSVDTPTNGHASSANVAEQLKEVIEVMNESGMLRSTEPEPQPTIEEIVERIAPLLENSKPDDRFDRLSSDISSLKDLIDKSDKDKLDARFSDLESRINTTGQAGMSDTQHSDIIRKDIETARINALADTMDKVVKPIIDMQATQAKFQTMMMVRQVEQQDGAKPGTYTQMFASTNVPDETVQTDLGKWRSRAGREEATA